jgi:CubicO group peptidase (beta-lactamase class C family)
MQTVAHGRLHRLVFGWMLVAAVACSSPTPPEPQAPTQERLNADTPKTTVQGHTFIAPAGWGLVVREAATILESPEGDSHIALVDVRADSADAAVAASWTAYGAGARGAGTQWPLKVTTDSPDKDGWSNIRHYSYQTSPNERRDVFAETRRSGDGWNVAIFDLAQATEEKRLAQVQLILDRLLPKGYAREAFSGRPAQTLDEARIAELSRFVEASLRELKIPGAAFGLVQKGQVVFAGGFGVRELGSAARPDGDTLFMIGSNTKALTTLLLAKLVEDKKLTWETLVTTLLPSFKLGNAETTKQVLVKHLICACTGLPRQDYEWIFQFKGVTPDGALATLSTIQPTSKFGEMFQYSNLLAGAAGFVGGHVVFPDRELGAAYDEAMRTMVFGPLRMTATTFDYARALRGNHASAHASDIDGRPARAVMELNDSIIPLRPAGAGWSSVRDMLKYVSMEIAEGSLADGRRYIGKEVLLARRAPQVPIGRDQTYGMGLMMDTTYGVAVVHHGGDTFGFHSDMMWLPDHQVGAIILTNGDPGWILRDVFRRKLLEVLFDGRHEADADQAAQGKTFFAQLAAERKLLTVPADPADAGTLASKYSNGALGDITVLRQGGMTTFDFGEFRSDVASRHNPDGTVSFLTTVPGFSGFEFVVGSGANRTLVVRDAQHEYVFAASQQP